MPAYVTWRWRCSSVQAAAERGSGHSPPASPSTPVVPGLQGLLAAREATLTGCILTTTSVCSAVSHCLLAAACKQRSADFTMPMAVLLLYHPVQLRVGCFYLSCVKHGLCCSLWCFLLAKTFNSSNHLYFYAKRRDTYILQIRYFFLYEKRKEEGIKKEMSSLSLAQKETVTFTPVVVKSITFSSSAPLSTELFIQ